MRIIEIEIRWKDTTTLPSERYTACVVDNDEEYYRLSEDQSFDERIFYYFLDEKELEDSKNPNNTEFEFTTLRVIEDVLSDGSSNTNTEA